MAIFPDVQFHTWSQILQTTSTLPACAGAPAVQGVGQWSRSDTEQPELNLHFVTVFYLQGHPVYPSRKQRHCLLWISWLLPCCSTKTFTPTSSFSSPAILMSA